MRGRGDRQSRSTAVERAAGRWLESAPTLLDQFLIIHRHLLWRAKGDEAANPAELRYVACQHSRNLSSAQLLR